MLVDRLREVVEKEWRGRGRKRKREGDGVMMEWRVEQKREKNREVCVCGEGGSRDRANLIIKASHMASKLSDKYSPYVSITPLAALGPVTVVWCCWYGVI